jgi:hypothetical protein
LVVVVEQVEIVREMVEEVVLVDTIQQQLLFLVHQQ